MAQKTPLMSSWPSNPAVEMQSALSLLQMMDELSENYPLTPKYLTKTLAVQFMDESSTSRRLNYKGAMAARLSDGASIVEIDWRSQKHQDDKEFRPIVFFGVDGTCFTKKEISDHFGEIFLIWGPSVRVDEKRQVWGYLKKIETTYLFFAFSANNKCLTHFGFRPNLTDQELRIYNDENEKFQTRATQASTRSKP